MIDVFRCCTEYAVKLDSVGGHGRTLSINSSTTEGNWWGTSRNPLAAHRGKREDECGM